TSGNVIAVRCTLDADTRHGMPGAERKVKGTIHWVSAAHAVAADVHLYDRLFDTADPDDETDGKTYRDHLNPNSRRSVRGYVEASAAEAAPGQGVHSERPGYFGAARRDHAPDKPVLNRVVTLRDSYAKAPGK